MITKFGKQLRKLRIDKTITLGAMAEAIGISPSYLSSIETGKRNITDLFFNSVVSYFDLQGDDVVMLKKMADLSQKEITLSLQNANDGQKNSAVFFARRLNELTDEDLENINSILNGELNNVSKEKR
jgi:HTH-type transcriptional regulator, competence development regulator